MAFDGLTPKEVDEKLAKPEFNEVNLKLVQIVTELNKQKAETFKKLNQMCWYEVPEPLDEESNFVGLKPRNITTTNKIASKALLELYTPRNAPRGFGPNKAAQRLMSICESLLRFYTKHNWVQGVMQGPNKSACLLQALIQTRTEYFRGSLLRIIREINNTSYSGIPDFNDRPETTFEDLAKLLVHIHNNAPKYV